MNLHHNNHPRTFLERFNHCYDGVLRRIQFRFFQSEMFGRVYITLSVRRPMTGRIKEGGWVNVRLAIKEVEEFALRENAKESCRVLSGGLQIGDFNGLLFFDFAPYSVSPEGLEDYRRSGCYVAGRSFSWKVEEYSEQEGAKKGRA